MEWDDDRREFVRRDRQWDRYSDPRGDRFESDRDRASGRDDDGREPGMRGRMRHWADRARSAMDDDERRRTSHERPFGRETYEDWRDTSMRGRDREDWDEGRDRGGWHAERGDAGDRHAARRWALGGDDRREGWFSRDDDRRGWGDRDQGWERDRRSGRAEREWDSGPDTRWSTGRNTRYGAWDRDDRRDLRGFSDGRDDGRRFSGDLGDIPRWNGRDFAPRHDEYRTEAWDDRRDLRDGSDHRGFFSKMKDRLAGRPPRSYRRSDERIREDICDRLMQSWIDADDVDVKVKDGEVTLTGTVRMRGEKRGLEDLAEQVLGVRDVNNHVKVRRDVDERMGMAGGTAVTPATGTAADTSGVGMTRGATEGIGAGASTGSSMGLGGRGTAETSAAGMTRGATEGVGLGGGTARGDGRTASGTPTGPANGTHHRT